MATKHDNDDSILIVQDADNQPSDGDATSVDLPKAKKTFVEEVDDLSFNWFKAMEFFFIFLLTPFVALIMLIWNRVLKPIYEWFMARIWPHVLAWWNDEDRWGLRVYGDSLLTDRVKKELRNNGRLLDAIRVFETFAWFSAWMLSGIGLFWSLVLTGTFVQLTLLMDAAIMRMSDPGGKKRWGVIMGRLSFVLFVSLVTSVPTEMMVFRGDINRAIEARQVAALALVAKKGEEHEQFLTDKLLADSDKALAGQPDAIVAQREKGRLEIATRLERMSKQWADEVARGSVTSNGKKTSPGNGPAAINDGLQVQEIRQELKDYVATTDSLRAAAVQASADARNEINGKLKATLDANSVMAPEDLAQKYTGDYKQSDGFMARFDTLNQLTDAPGPNGEYLTSSRLIAWGCRLIMVLFGLGTLFMKFVNSSQEQKDYYDPEAQAMAGNTEVKNLMVIGAKRGEPEALNLVKRMAIDGDVESLKVMRNLGYDGDLKAACMPKEVTVARHHLVACSDDLEAAYDGFTDAFRGLCRERDQHGVALTLDVLKERAELLWRTEVTPKVKAFGGAEYSLRSHAVQVPFWSANVQKIMDDVNSRQFLWNISDDELERHYGWSDPDAIVVPATPVPAIVI